MHFWSFQDFLFSLEGTRELVFLQHSFENSLAFHPMNFFVINKYIPILDTIVNVKSSLSSSRSVLSLVSTLSTS